MNPEEALLAEQQEEVCDSALRPSGGGHWIMSTRLADLFSAAVALVAEIEFVESTRPWTALPPPFHERGNGGAAACVGGKLFPINLRHR
ncbi:unnamed protein product [Lampetra planeri]